MKNTLLDCFNDSLSLKTLTECPKLLSISGRDFVDPRQESRLLNIFRTAKNQCTGRADGRIFCIA